MESVGLDRSSVMQSAKARRRVEFDGCILHLENGTMHLREDTSIICIVQSDRRLSLVYINTLLSFANQ